MTTTPAQSTTPTAIAIVPVSSRADLKRFIEYPYRLYRNHPVWVPPLLVSEWEAVDPKKNPALEHAEVQRYLAVSGGRVVGRVSAVVDRAFNAHWKQNTALFGAFEAEGAEAARGLLEAVEGWARARGLETVRGPVPASLNDLTGMLIENFEDPPAVLMPYNGPEYQGYLEGAGFEKAMDTFAWRMYSAAGMPERVLRIAERVKRNLGVQLREVNFKNLKADILIIRDIFNRAWAENWGFMPVSEREANRIANELKLVADRKATLIAEVGGRPVAFTIMLPDINQSLRGTGGRLFPLGLPKLLLGKPKRSRLYALGVVPEYRGKGLDALLYAESYRRGIGRYSSGEFGITLESNTAINEGMKAVGAEPYKRYRVFEKRL